MSGLTTAIAIAGLGVAGLGTGLAAYNGIKSNNNQQAALKNQTTATQTAEAASLSTERKNETATNAANQQTPDISSILTQAANASKVGVGSTMLTGPGGVGGGSLSLGKPTLLGS
jgi:hypothetical protein